MTYLFDTDIIIDYLRDLPQATEIIEKHINGAYLSVMNVAELYQGIRSDNERTQLESMLSVFTILPLTPNIAIQGGLFSSKYRASHGCGLADCLIAATADAHGLMVLTLNVKHYPMIKKIKAPYKK